MYDLGIDREESANAELDDEHVGNALGSPLFTKESEAEASLAQTYHSNEAKFVERSTISFGKFGAIRRLADKTDVEPRVET